MQQYPARSQLVPRAMAGYTVAEAMVAVTLGMLLISGVFTFMSMGAQTYVSQSAVSDIQDRGRVAFDILTSHVRQAGLNESELGGTRLDNALVGIEGEDGDPDSVEINSEAGPAVESSAPLVDCVGNFYPGAPGSPTAGMFTMSNTFALLGDQLRCTNALGEAVTLTSNVDDFQLLYGFDVNNDGVPDQYANADLVDEADAIAVSVCMILSSEDNTVPVTQKYEDCNGEEIKPDDLRARRVINLTINLRN